MRLILGERIVLRPTVQFEVGNDVLPGGRTGGLPEQAYRLPNAVLVMPHAPMAHAVLRRSGKLVQPLVDLCKRLTDQRN